MGKDLAAYNTKLVGWVERSETHHLTPFGKHRWVSRVAQPTLRADEAIVWFEKGRGSMPAVPVLHSRLAAAYALRGESERAAAELAEARRLDGDLYSSIAHLKASTIDDVKAGGSQVVPKIRALYEATYFAGLRKAGMPEE
jgi:hypothetical protein